MTFKQFITRYSFEMRYTLSELFRELVPIVADRHNYQSELEEMEEEWDKADENFYRTGDEDSYADIIHPEEFTPQVWYDDNDLAVDYEAEYEAAELLLRHIEGQYTNNSYSFSELQDIILDFFGFDYVF